MTLDEIFEKLGAENNEVMVEGFTLEESSENRSAIKGIIPLFNEEAIIEKKPPNKEWVVLPNQGQLNKYWENRKSNNDVIILADSALDNGTEDVMSIYGVDVVKKSDGVWRFVRYVGMN